MSEELTEDRLIELAIEWILANSVNARNEPEKVSAEGNLLEEGILDSLGFVDLLTHLEKLTGKEVDLMEVDEDDLSSLRGMCAVALNAAPVA